jgi:hypothetical protein
VTRPAAATIAALAVAAGHPLADDRCDELVPLFEALLAGADRLRSVDLTGHEPVGAGAPVRE